METLFHFGSYVLEGLSYISDIIQFSHILSLPFPKESEKERAITSETKWKTHIPIMVNAINIFI